MLAVKNGNMLPVTSAQKETSIFLSGCHWLYHCLLHRDLCFATSVEEQLVESTCLLLPLSQAKEEKKA